MRFKSAVLDSQLFDKIHSPEMQKNIFREILQTYFIEPEALVMRMNLNKERILEYQTDLSTINTNRVIYNMKERNSRLKPRDVIDVLNDSLLVEYYITPDIAVRNYRDKIYAYSMTGRSHLEVKYIGSLAEFKELNKRLNSLINNNIGGEILRKSLKELSEFLLKPFYEDLDSDYDRVHISPDGLLHHINFATLLDNNNEFLGDRFPINHINSGKDLLYTSQEKRELETSCLIFADPLFQFREVHEEPDSGFSYQVAQNISDITLRDAMHSQLSNLPGSRLEAEKISEVLKKYNISSNVFLGKDASKQNLLLHSSPSILHISTHGLYFRDDKFSDSNGSFANNSFLALAGAQNTLTQWSLGKTVREIDLGILTIEDISKMNLVDTELVTLSACESGLGSVIPTEGIGGIRRAFHLAGARSLLMTTKKIEDKFSADYMGNYYRFLMNKEELNALKAYQKTFSHYIRLLKAKDDPLLFIKKVSPFIISSKIN